MSSVSQSTAVNSIVPSAASPPVIPGPPSPSVTPSSSEPSPSSDTPSVSSMSITSSSSSISISASTSSDMTTTTTTSASISTSTMSTSTISTTHTTSSSSTSFSSSSSSSSTFRSTTSSSSTTIRSTTLSTPPPPPPPTTTISSTLSPPPTTTTFPSTIFITTTNSHGSSTTSAPAAITSTLTSTGTDGNVSTVTQVGINPTLSPDNSTATPSSFFHNRGAVAGVFVLVGLAAASIFLWVVFAIYRRRRTQQREREATIAATLAAAGFNRAPLDDDDDFRGGRSKIASDIEMTHRSSSGLAPSMAPSTGRAPSGHYEPVEVFNPYAEYIVRSGSMDGYVPARTISPPLVGASDRAGPSNHVNGEPRRFGHSTSDSTASNEPLLAAHRRTISGSPPTYFSTLPSSTPPSPPPRNPLRLLDNQIRARSKSYPNQENMGYYVSARIGDDRLDPGLQQRLRSDLRDEEDYSRPVLGVRNISDDAGLAQNNN